MNVETLQTVAAAIVADPGAQVQSWEATPFDSGQSRAAVHRIRARVEASAGLQDISVVHKSCINTSLDGHALPADDPSWKREALIYESGILADVTTGFRPPRCYAIDWPSSTECGLWLEDAGDRWSETWSIERYGRAARHLGQFNARYVVDERVPDHDFLGRGQWRESVDSCAADAERLQVHRHHPEVEAVYDDTTTDRLLQIWDRRDEIITRGHAGSPLSLSHGDTTGRNQYDIPSRPDETIAIDWYYIGLSPLGEDPARMLGSSLHWFFIDRMREAEDLTEAVWTGYLQGMADVGWRGDREGVRHVFGGVLATIYGLSYTGTIGQILQGEVESHARRAYGCSGEQLLNHRREMGRFFSQLGS